jgi:hypothetical protein
MVMEVVVFLVGEGIVDGTRSVYGDVLFDGSNCQFRSCRGTDSYRSSFILAVVEQFGR